VHPNFVDIFLKVLTIPEVYKRSKWTGKEKFGIGLYNDFKALKNEFDE